MTQVHITPAESTNQDVPTELVDNKGAPINADGTPREVSKDKEAEPTVESLQKQLKDTKAALTKSQQGKAEEPAQDTELPAKVKESELQLDTAAQAAKDAGVNVDKMAEEYTKDGKISDESYKELADKGFDKATVDNYFEGREAVATLQQAEVIAVVGGQEEFNQLQEWASDNLSEDEIAVYNEAVITSTAAAKMAVEAIQNKYIQANGQSPKLIGGDTSTNVGSDVFKSSHEMVRAMGDKRYSTDPDYQKEIEAKVARSIKAGKI
jgi:hypothetical protein